MQTKVTARAKEDTLVVGRVYNDEAPEMTDIDFEKLSQFPLTDTGNAEAFVYLNRNTARYDHRYKKWYFWSPPLWRRDGDGRISRRITEMVRMRQRAFGVVEPTNKKMKRWGIESESASRISATRSRVESMMPISTEGGYWDENDWLIGCENGLIDLRSGKLRVGTQEDLVTLSTKLLYDENAKCPRWLKFLEEVFETQDMIDYVQRAFGYSLTGSIKEEIVFLCYGTGANGKSKMVNRLRDILGDYAWATAFSTFANMERAGGATQEIAELAWARAVVASESKESSKLNEARLKSLTGGETISARFLYTESFQFRPRLKIWMSANHKPQVEDTSHGFWRRIHLLPFEKQFSGKNQDRDLEDKLRNETVGILAWAVQGAVAWGKQGLNPVPQKVQEETLKLQQQNDEVEEFIGNCFVRGDESMKVKFSDAYTIYKEYCEEVGNDKPLPNRQLWNKFEAHGVKSKRLKDGFAWVGLGKKDSDHSPEAQAEEDTKDDPLFFLNLPTKKKR